MAELRTQCSRTVLLRSCALLCSGLLLLVGCTSDAEPRAVVAEPTVETAAEPTVVPPEPAPEATQAAKPAAPTSDPAPTPTSEPAPTVVPVPAEPTGQPVPEPTQSPNTLPPRAADAPQPDCELAIPHFGPFDIVNVAADDPDGGLIVHTDPGVDTPQVGVFEPDARNIRMTGQCADLPDGSDWWFVIGGDMFGWVNAAYLGDRVNPADQLSVTPCSTVGDLQPSAGGGTVPADLAITDISFQTSDACDRVVVELGEGWTFQRLPRSFSRFPEGLVAETVITDSEVEVRFTEAMNTAFDTQPPRATWLDAATGEQNAALAIDGNDGTALWAGWGTGDGVVRFLHDPARIVIDIFQEPTPDGAIVGPIVSGGPILFEPIQSGMDPLTGPVRLRGFSYGFEAQSTFTIQPWDQQPDSGPLDWEGELFGRAELTPVDLPIDVSPGEGLFDIGNGRAFTTAGYFDFTIDGLPPGGWQIAVSPSNGLGCPSAVGQQFVVGDEDSPTESQTPPSPFSLAHDFGDWTEERVRAERTIVTVVPETAATTPGTCQVHF